MLSIGITGGIGSGKTTVANIFASFGIPLFNSDDAAKELMEHNSGLRAKIIQSFGTESYQDGRLNRSFLAKAVFNNKEQLATLNAIVHPAVIQYAKEWTKQQTAPYVLKESALFFESGSYRDMDFIIGVSAPEPLRIERVKQRSGWTETEVRKRMEKQMPEEEKMKRCDFIILNDGEQDLKTQVELLHEKLITLSR